MTYCAIDGHIMDAMGSYYADSSKNDGGYWNIHFYLKLFLLEDSLDLEDILVLSEINRGFRDYLNSLENNNYEYRILF